jgi:hypothetical protein
MVTYEKQTFIIYFLPLFMLTSDIFIFQSILSILLNFQQGFCCKLECGITFFKLLQIKL